MIVKHLSSDLGVTVYPAHATAQGAPAPRTLLLAHGYGCDQGMWHDLLPLLAQHRCITSAIMAKPDLPTLAADLAARFCAMDPAIALRWARATFLTVLRSVVPQVSVPTLVLQCRDDAIAGPAVGQWVASQLPNGRLLWLEACGHCPQMSHPAEVARVLQAALHAPATA